MNDPLLMSSFESLRNLPCDRECLIDGNRSASDPLRQILAIDQFHDERLDAITLLQAVDVGDVRMIEGREDLRFSPESSKSVGIRRERIRQNLQGIVSVEREVTRSPDLAHPAFANQGGDFIRTYASAGTQ